MTACPTCGHDPEAKHRSELERQFPTDAAWLRDQVTRIAERGQSENVWGSADPAEGLKFIIWRSLVWTRVRVRKPAVCVRSGRVIGAGDWAWRQLSEVRNRDHRVADDAWGTP